MVTIGLTGNVGAGKSTVAGFWKNERGAVVIDADHLGREAVKPGNKTMALLVDRFGKEILLPDESLDRSLMGQIAFSSRENLIALNEIVHPEIVRLIKEELKEAEKKHTRAVVVDAALIIEFGFEGYLDYLVVVDAPQNVRIERMLALKKMEKSTLERVIEMQMAAEELKLRADYVIENDGNMERLKVKALAIFDRMLEEREGEITLNDNI
jgi:dephospho-CoA kinase